MRGRLKLGQILVNRGALNPDQLAAALAQQQQSGARLGMTLVRMGFVDEETLIRTLAGQLKLPVARIRGKRVGADVLECIGVDLAEKHRCLPLFFKQEGSERVLFVAMEDPSDSDALDEIARVTGEQLRAVLVGPTELEEALQRHYHWASLTGESEWQVARPVGEIGAAAGGSARLADADTAPELPDPDAEVGAARGEGAEDAPPERRFDLAGPDPSAPPAPPPALRPDSLDPRIILRALSQLLVEKGLIGRDELVQRLGDLAAQEGARRDR